MHRLPLAGLLALSCLLPSGCGGSPASQASSSGVFINISLPANGWAQDIDYSTKGEVPMLTLDGVVFELRNPESYQVDWKAIGMDGITITNASYRSTTPHEGVFFLVEGKEVRVTDGMLTLGGEDIGRVESGDRVSVDAGLEIL